MVYLVEFGKCRICGKALYDVRAPGHEKPVPRHSEMQHAKTCMKHEVVSIQNTFKILASLYQVNLSQNSSVLWCRTFVHFEINSIVLFFVGSFETTPSVWIHIVSYLLSWASGRGSTNSLFCIFYISHTGFRALWDVNLQLIQIISPFIAQKYTICLIWFACWEMPAVKNSSQLCR